MIINIQNHHSSPIVISKKDLFSFLDEPATGHWQLLELLPRWDEDEIVLSFKLLLLSLFDELSELESFTLLPLLLSDLAGLLSVTLPPPDPLELFLVFWLVI